MLVWWQIGVPFKITLIIRVQGLDYVMSANDHSLRFRNNSDMHVKRQCDGISKGIAYSIDKP